MTQLDRISAERILGETGWLSEQPKAFRVEVLRQSISLHFAPGEMVYRYGDRAGGIYGLVSGIISGTTAPPDSKPRLVHIGAPGAWTGEVSFLTRQPRRVGWRALVDTWMMHLPLEAMDRMAAGDPEALRRFAQILVRTADVLVRVIHDLQKPDAAQRIASVLQRLIRVGKRPIPLSQTELGIMANASRKQVNAALQRFAAAGWIVNTYRAITIVDAAALVRFAEDGDANPLLHKDPSKQPVDAWKA